MVVSLVGRCCLVYKQKSCDFEVVLGGPYVQASAFQDFLVGSFQMYSPWKGLPGTGHSQSLRWPCAMGQA